MDGFEAMFPKKHVKTQLNLMFQPPNRLYEFTASDAKKDSQSKPYYDQPIENIWGEVIPSEKFRVIKDNLIDLLLKGNVLRTESYTRIPGRNAESFDAFNPNYVIFDAGPKYNGDKTQKSIKDPSGKLSSYLKTTSEIIDSASKKSTNKITQHVTEGYVNLDKFGFPNTTFRWAKNNNKFEIQYKSIRIDQSTINNWNIGNKKISEQLALKTNDTEKECLIIVKALGDALKVFFAYLYSMQYPANNYALLTHDNNLFFRALMFLKDVPNALILYSKLSTSGPKTTKVIIKSTPPNYKLLCENILAEIDETHTYYIMLLNKMIKIGHFKIYNNDKLFINEGGFLESYIEAIEENIEHIQNVSKGTSKNYKQDYYAYMQYRPSKLFQIEILTFGDEVKIKGLVQKISTGSTYRLPRNKCPYTRGPLILISNFGGGLSHFTDEPLTLGHDWLQIYYLVYNIYFEILTKPELTFFRSIGMAPNYDLKDAEHVKKNDVEPFIQENTLYELLAYYFEAYHDYSDEAIRKYINELKPFYETKSMSSRTMRTKRPTLSKRSTLSKRPTWSKRPTLSKRNRTSKISVYV